MQSPCQGRQSLVIRAMERLSSVGYKGPPGFAVCGRIIQGCMWSQSFGVLKKAVNAGLLSVLVQSSLNTLSWNAGMVELVDQIKPFLVWRSLHTYVAKSLKSIQGSPRGRLFGESFRNLQVEVVRISAELSDYKEDQLTSTLCSNLDVSLYFFCHYWVVITAEGLNPVLST